MKRRFWFSLASILVLGIGGLGSYGYAPAWHQTTKVNVLACCGMGGLKEQVLMPFVEVRTDRGLGSGTAILVGDEILVLTAGHVVEDNMKPVESTHWDPIQGWKTIGDSETTPVTLYRDYGPRKMQQLADIVFYSPVEEKGGHDLALLRPRDPSVLTPASICTHPTVEEGDDAWYIGSPAGLHASLEKTIINRLNVYIPDLHNTYFTVNGHVWFGSSGCGVYIKTRGDYQLIGVVVRAASSSPKTPALCQTPKTLANFLAEYAKSRTKS